MAKKISKTAAKQLAKKQGINFRQDSSKLSISDKDFLSSLAKLQGYRKPKTASGSLGRYYFEYLKKVK